MAVPISSLLFAGDIMLNGVAPSRRTFEGIAPVVRRADLAFANLEVPLTTSRIATTRKSAEEIKRRDQFVLKADPRHAPFLAASGFDLFSLGNNHAMDYGPQGLDQTRALLDGQNLAYAGAGANAAEASHLAIRVLPDGTRVGMVSAMAFVTTKALEKVSPATPTAAGVNAFDFGGVIGPRARRTLSGMVKNAKRRCDLLVVAVHWGTERKTLPNPYQVALGRAIVDAGADVVWGHHPHVLQGAEIYRGKPILYSMGNLISAVPADTGLITMRRGSFAFTPARIRSGRVSLTTEDAGTAARRRFIGLCAELVKKYPHRRAKPLHSE